MHLSIRMAWHDNNWNGKVCCNPENNTYCTGSHSLLSGRIEKKKDVKRENTISVKDEYVAENFQPANVPPCYWSINAFSDHEFPVEHHHAFNWVPYAIEDVIKKYSVITWPFKLSFVHNEDKKKIHGNYPTNLNDRIENFINKFKPNESIIFFYANYDNPVSADDMKYLLLGCSEIRELPEPKHFPFTDDELEEIRGESITMSNFPTMNWMLQFTHNPNSSVLLPYREYINYIEKHPESEQLLQDIKVIIEEESLIRGFKYVCMDLDDDKCLYLLYKIRKSIKKAQEHNEQVLKSDLKEEERRINVLIEKVWKKRGIYPSLKFVLNDFIQDLEISDELTEKIIPLLSGKHDLLDLFSEILGKNIPEQLLAFEDELLELSGNRIFKKHHFALAKLSLFFLTENQIKKIISNKKLLSELEINPYILYEEYLSDDDDLDIPDMQDEPIDVFKIDMGMIPDKKYVNRHRKIQNLVEDSPERVRSVIINYLWQIGNNGHCYDSVDFILKELYEHPLIYKNEIKLDDEALLNLEEDYKTHFVQKLFITPNNKYFYLQAVKKAEKQVEQIISKLLIKTNSPKKQIDIDKHITISLEQLQDTVKTDDQKELFTHERKQLYKNIFTKSFYLLTGKPGAGKTYETSKIIEHLYNIGEDVLVLAPTGKAALRLTENIKKYTSLTTIEAKTIDKYIFEKNFGWCYEDWEGTLALDENEKITVENLIVDESSMIDLNKFTILLSIIKFTDKYPNRLILVGDENQLPPIGFGKPFYDIIQFIQKSEKLSDTHYINLKSNCRQENDENILKLADAFTDKTRCYEEAFNIINKVEGKKSQGLYVYKWKNKDDLNSRIESAFENVFNLDLKKTDIERTDFQKLNELFGLYETGYVNNQGYKFRETLEIENLQLLSPYRTGYFGTVGLNKQVQGKFRNKNPNEKIDKYFHHADKIIRLFNWYTGRKGENRKLKLSNGSTGVITVKPKYFFKDGKKIEYEERNYYFRDADKPMSYVDDEENFDLAYAITVHKSQGSDFRNVFLVIPQKQSLLSKELLYTALTRSKFRLFIFVQDSKENLLMIAKNNSHLINRNTSIYSEPIDKKAKFIPEPGITVASKIEFIIFEALKKSSLTFKYEAPLKLKNLSYDIHPDFTIYLRNGNEIYWEHLGMLDTRKYFNDWQERKRNYYSHGLSDSLITTDDLNGVDHNKLTAIIDNIREMELISTPNNKFSEHHYQLYE